MAKRKLNKGMGFAIFMVVYAVLALGGICFGLKWFWGFMEGYEASRPHVAIDAYMEDLTRDRIVKSCTGLLENVDMNIQSEEECLNYLYDCVQGEFSYARKASACTETSQTYVLRSGDLVVGSFTIEAGAEDAYGFRPWRFKEESFQLPDMMGTESVSVTVPQGYDVYVNGFRLDESYIVKEESREFEVLEFFYGTYDLPELVLVTYKAGPFMNAQFQMEVYDPEGQPFVMDENFDENTLIALSDETVKGELDAFLDKFIDAYVLFAGCANDNRYANYNHVIQYVVPDSNLAQRMREALDGLLYAQSRGDKVAEIDVHHYVAVAENKYMVDVTYKVDTTGNEGVVQTTTNVKMIVVESNGRYLVESMIGY